MWVKSVVRGRILFNVKPTIGECNEMIIHLSFVRDLKYVDVELCKELIDIYDKGGEQLYNLGKSWLK